MATSNLCVGILNYVAFCVTQHTDFLWLTMINAAGFIVAGWAEKL